MSYDTEWHYVGEAGEPAFENGWANWKDVQPQLTEPNLRFMKGSDGIIKIQGLPFSQTSNNSQIFTLPEDYRPPCEFYQGFYDKDTVIVSTNGKVYLATDQQVRSINVMFHSGESEAGIVQGEQGEQGETGAPPEHEWSGTSVRFKNPDGTWGDFVDLKGVALITFLGSNSNLSIDCLSGRG